MGRPGYGRPRLFTTGARSFARQRGTDILATLMLDRRLVCAASFVLAGPALACAGGQLIGERSPDASVADAFNDAPSVPGRRTTADLAVGVAADVAPHAP